MCKDNSNNRLSKKRARSPTSQHYNNQSHNKPKQMKQDLYTYINEIDDSFEFDYESYYSPKVEKEKVIITQKIDSLDDLIKLIDKYPLAENIEYNINMEALHSIKYELKQLSRMIGMNNLKNHVVNQIIYYIQGFHTISNGNDFMHTVIYGPPGTGKTDIAKIIGRIFCNIGILSSNKFRKVTRSELVAGYLGQTALKTRKVIEDCIGGVLFIDEAYSLGNSDKKDSFAKECVDTLCECLSDYKSNLMVIIAGYEQELDKCFFSLNQGLNSRFTWRFNTEKYNYKELHEIFIKKIKDANWLFTPSDKTIQWFKENCIYFSAYGRDIETLFAKVKIAHSKRVFCLDASEKTKIKLIDLKEGMKMFTDNENIKKRKTSNEFLHSMYS